MTLNKNGAPRKKGSGRPKGSNCFAVFSLKQLGELLPQDAEIVVSHKWAKTLAAESGFDVFSELKSKPWKQI